jgi:hypothetical protein
MGVDNVSMKLLVFAIDLTIYRLKMGVTANSNNEAYIIYATEKKDCFSKFDYWRHCMSTESTF